MLMKDFLDYLKDDHYEIDRLLDELDEMDQELLDDDWDETDPPYHIMVDEE